jgi:hypothetical protein
VKETEAGGEKVLYRAREGKDTLSNLDLDNKWIRKGE